MLLPILARPLDDVRLSVLGIVVCDVCVNSEDVELEDDDDDDVEDADDEAEESLLATDVAAVASDVAGGDATLAAAAAAAATADVAGSTSIWRRQSATILARLRRLALTNGTCSVVSLSLSDDPISTASTLSTIIKFIGIFS